MANFLYNSAKTGFVNGTIDWDDSTIKAMLVKDTYTPDKDHKFVADVTPASNELSDASYSRKTLQNKTVTQDDVNDVAKVDSDDLTWTAINAGTAAGMVIYKENTGDADNVLIAYINDGGFPVTTNGGDLIMEFNAEGIIQLA